MIFYNINTINVFLRDNKAPNGAALKNNKIH